MAKNPCSMIALPVKWTTSRSATVTDSAGVGRTATLIPSGTLWTRTFLAPATGGTIDAPVDLIRTVETALNATPGLWSLALRDTGRVRITYTGAGTGSIVWGLATSVGRVLGFSTDIGPLASGASVDAGMMPAFCWFPYTLDTDEGFRSAPTMMVGAPLGNGLEVVWNEGTQRLTRTLRARFAPTSEAKRVEKGLNATPFWPPMDAPERYTRPSIVPENCPNGWTVHETLSCAPGLRIGYSLYELPELIAGSTDRYIVGGITKDSVAAAQNRAALSIGSYTILVDVPSVEFTFSTTETR